MTELATKLVVPKRSSKNGSELASDIEPIKVIDLQRIEDESVPVQIEGLSPLIIHRWSEKSLKQMRDKQQGVMRQKKEPKNAEEEAYDSCYWLDEARTQPGMPATAFKGAMVSACRFFDSVTMVAARTYFFVEGEGSDQLVPITGERRMREDTPRNTGGVPDLRYRFAFYPWSALLVIRYPRGHITSDSVIALLDAAGRVGVGDWRPGSPKSTTGTFGTFRVK